MAKTKKTQGKLARYVNTPEAMKRFRRHYGVPDDVHLEYRIVNGVAELNRRLGFNLTVHDIIATYFLRTTQHEAFSLRPRDVNNTLVNSLPDTNKEMTDDFLLVRGNWYFPGHRWPTADGKPEEKKKQVQAHLTDPVALQAVYDSEVCVDEYANPRSAYKLLRYTPSARTFLQCRQVRNLAEALANPANQSPPAHDIRDMAGINLKKLLPPTRPQAETSELILPLERKRKRKGALKGEASQAVAPTDPDTALAASKKPEARPVLPGVDTLPSNEDADVEVVGPFVPSRDPNSSEVLAPFWAPLLEAQGERVRTDATVLRTGGSGSSTTTALCEVARLPGDMDVWGKSTNQEVINNLRQGLMMAVQGSLEIGDRFQRQAAELQNSLRVATRSFELRNESERMRREVEAYKEQDLLRNALEENSKAGEKIQALEAEIAAREKAAFDRGSVEAQTIMTKQLPGIYNEAFQQGWKALYSWEESDDMPQLPPQGILPYPDAPIGVPEEELPEPQPSADDVAGPSNS
uniref:Uncharacterized protein n=1 Tax=Fagus sylvatica TaxID=28930 RepID=A0A2N9GIY7_FAGSY